MESFLVPVCVTAKHIAQGQRNLGHCCPVALALKAALKAQKLSLKWIHVSFDFCILVLDQGKVLASIPSDARLFIANFDRHGAAAVAPLEFPLKFNPPLPSQIEA